MGKSKLVLIISIAFIILSGLGKFYEFQNTSKKASNDIQFLAKKFNTLSKSDRDKIEVLIIGIIIGSVGTYVIKSR